MTYYEVDRETGIKYEVNEVAEVQRLITEIGGQRGWTLSEQVGWSALRIAKLEFKDSEGSVLWTGTLLSDTIHLMGEDGNFWLVDWPGGMDRVLRVAERVEDEEGPEMSDDGNASGDQ
jgi:hypothetical protein